MTKMQLSFVLFLLLLSKCFCQQPTDSSKVTHDLLEAESPNMIGWEVPSSNYIWIPQEYRCKAINLGGLMCERVLQAIREVRDKPIQKPVEPIWFTHKGISGGYGRCPDFYIMRDAKSPDKVFLYAYVFSEKEKRRLQCWPDNL